MKLNLHRTLKPIRKPTFLRKFKLLYVLKCSRQGTDWYYNYVDNREVTVLKKFSMVAELASQFELPQNDVVVGRCYNAIDVAFRDCVARMQTYFLVEGTIPPY